MIAYLIHISANYRRYFYVSQYKQLPRLAKNVFATEIVYMYK